MSVRRTRSRRVRVALLTGLAAVLVFGALLDRGIPGRLPVASARAPLTAEPDEPRSAREATAADRGAAPPAADARTVAEMATREMFARGVELLGSGEHRRAAVVFHAVLVRAPEMPEAHVNLGFALLADGRADAARDRFEQAIDLRPGQVNAYWGLAVALEAGGDLPGALGAMRSYVHLVPPGDPFVTRARSALWEWQAALAAGGTPERVAGGTP